MCAMLEPIYCSIATCPQQSDWVRMVSQSLFDGSLS